ncbi:MAG: RnfABCDGE type electron transport complex subunit C [Alistipes sp.]
MLRDSAKAVFTRRNIKSAKPRQSPISAAGNRRRAVVATYRRPGGGLRQKGDAVRVGQVIGTAAGFVSSNIHAPVSGTVVAVDATPDTGGIRRPSISIRAEGDVWIDTIDRSDRLVKTCDLSKEEIFKKITEAGLVGMGGATFPTHVKLAVPAGKTAEMLIVNGVECEPFLTADHRLMLEKGAEILVGVDILAKALGTQKAYIGIENNKPDAIERLTQLAVEYPHIEIVPLRVRYPQGGEKQLIEAITGREVPSGGLPIDVGAVVQNVGTAFAVYEAVQKQAADRTDRHRDWPPPASAVEPAVRIGTLIASLIEYCAVSEDAGKVVGGGPMMCRAIADWRSGHQRYLASC